jgi:hypothetical protein
MQGVGADGWARRFLRARCCRVLARRRKGAIPTRSGQATSRSLRRRAPSDAPTLQGRSGERRYLCGDAFNGGEVSSPCGASAAPLNAATSIGVSNAIWNPFGAQGDEDVAPPASALAPAPQPRSCERVYFRREGCPRTSDHRLLITDHFPLRFSGLTVRVSTANRRAGRP